jgi:hypothetical protein
LREDPICKAVVRTRAENVRPRRCAQAFFEGDLVSLKKPPHRRATAAKIVERGFFLTGEASL